MRLAKPRAGPTYAAIVQSTDALPEGDYFAGVARVRSHPRLFMVQGAYEETGEPRLLQGWPRDRRVVEIDGNVCSRALIVQIEREHPGLRWASTVAELDFGGGKSVRLALGFRGRTCVALVAPMNRPHDVSSTG